MKLITTALIALTMATSAYAGHWDRHDHHGGHGYYNRGHHVQHNHHHHNRGWSTGDVVAATIIGGVITGAIIQSPQPRVVYEQARVVYVERPVQRIPGAMMMNGRCPIVDGIQTVPVYVTNVYGVIENAGCGY